MPLATSRPLETAAVMDAMDHDVHLFTDAATGQDAIIHRAGPSGLRLTRQDGIHPSPSTPGEQGLFTTNPCPAPTLTETDAVDQVRAHGLPFPCCTDPSTGRGRDAGATNA